MGPKKSLVEVTHDEGYGDSLLLHINNAFGGKDMRAEKIVASATAASKIEGIPEGWEFVRVGTPKPGEHLIGKYGKILHCSGVFKGCNYVIIRKKQPKYRSFANAAEYMQRRLEVFAVDWKTKKDTHPGFFVVIAANERYLWVAFGDVITRFNWGESIDKLVFRHQDGSTSPFGVEVTE